MPAFVIDSPQGTILCSPNPSTGQPDRKSDVPGKPSFTSTQVQIVGEQRPRNIISLTGSNGRRVFLVDGSTVALKNKDLRRALNKARTQLLGLVKIMQPLAAEVEDHELVRSSLQSLLDWTKRNTSS